MPYTTYGLQKAIRSHTIDSPSVQESLGPRRPNACNLCHLDKTLAWTGEHLERWYGIGAPELDPYEQRVPASVIWLLRGDAGQRALAAFAMGWEPAQHASGTDWQAQLLSTVLEDPYGAVRTIAGRTLRTLPGFEEFEYDFLGSHEELAKSSARALARWKRQRRRDGGDTTGRTLLDDPDKALPLNTFQLLLAWRDDRPVNLKE
jgi:hypothetical protein